MKKCITSILVVLLCLACNKKKFFKGPDFFQDDFESYVSLNEMFPEEDSLWSFTQRTRAQNTLNLDTTHAAFGNSSLRFFAQKSDDQGASKSSIAKQNMVFWENETLRMQGWYFIEDTNALNWLFLMDMEEQTAVGTGPGMRLALVDNKLRVEYKFNEKDLIQQVGQEIDFPRNEWVELTWEVKLSRKDKGSVKLWQNGQLLINRDHIRTLPKDLLYFQQGTKGMYSSCEIGITANSKDSDLTLWVDHIRFEKVN